MDIEAKVRQANSQLKEDKVRVRIHQTGDKLYLRATLPPKPNSGKNYTHQQWIALAVQANSEGIKQAEARARLVSAQLGLKEFSWEPYLKTSEPKEQMVADWIAAFEKNYFETRDRTPKTLTTWKEDYLRVFKKLPEKERLTEDLLRAVVVTTKADSRTRRRYAIAGAALAKFAGLEVNFKPLIGKYSPHCAAPRDLPSDELIAKVRAEIKATDWQWAFGVLAAYGLRPHELFHLSFEAFPTLYVLEGKTGFRHVRPIYPEWAELWNLQEAKVPRCSGWSNRELGNRVGHAFRRHKIPFNAYNLRHRWAVRSMEWGYDLSLAAAEMGHSTQVHSTLYHRWISQDVHDRAFEKLKNNPNQLKAPIYPAQHLS